MRHRWLSGESERYLEELKRLQQEARHLLDVLPDGVLPRLGEHAYLDLYRTWEHLTARMLTLEAVQHGTVACQHCGEKDRHQLLMQRQTSYVLCTGCLEQECAKAPSEWRARNAYLSLRGC